jgi:murein DD-endopeptidase MepM/ murein hydrolase activator NlpD
LSPKEKRKYFTLMIIPHSEAKVRQVKIPWSWIRGSGYLLACTILIISYFYYDYGQVKANLPELYRLREVNQMQQSEIEKLADQAADVQEKVSELEALEHAVKEYLSGTSLSSVQQDDRVVTTLASRSRDCESRVRIAGGTSSNVTARGGAPGRDSAPAMVENIAATFSSAEQQLANSKENLQGLLKSLEERQIYLDAKPSIWPTQGRISSRYGYRKSPFTGRREFHEGIDIAASTGTPVRATGTGVVTFAGWHSGYGQTVMIDHGYGFKTRYAHNSKLVVKKGMRVEKGDVIAYVGSTGRSTGPHLHYEVHLNGKTQNPANYLS